MKKPKKAKPNSYDQLLQERDKYPVGSLRWFTRKNAELRSKQTRPDKRKRKPKPDEKPV